MIRHEELSVHLRSRSRYDERHPQHLLSYSRAVPSSDMWMILSRSVVYHPPQHRDLSMLGIFEMGIGVLIQPLRLMHTQLLVSIRYLSLSLIRAQTDRVYPNSRSVYSVLQTLMETVPQMQMISVLSYLEVVGKTDARQYKYELMEPLSVISSVDSYPHRAPLSSLVWGPMHVSSVTKNLVDSS